MGMTAQEHTLHSMMALFMQMDNKEQLQLITCRPQTFNGNGSLARNQNKCLREKKNQNKSPTTQQNGELR